AVTPGTVLVRCTDLGNVNGSGSARQDALEINGSAGDGRQQVSAFVGQPIVLSLDSSNSGPVHANYAVWIWRAAVANTAPLRVGGSIVGCVYDPTPLTGGSPQPFTCVHSPAFGTFCAGLSVRASPPTTPWTLTRAQGFHVPLSFTLQAILEDDASDNPQHLSVSNVVILRVHM
ncbi:MAG: hypothetical protein HYR85_24965, partial [Planctomycetes bacterium]|nr:hypothetical protein [Planctomycetota bacterium]